MIPIIFDNPILIGNGYGRMADAISCTVTHEINGQYELAMEYPVTGQHYDRIEAGMVLFAAPDPVTAEQPFRIYRVTRPLNGVVTVYARHIAYDMSGISVLPFTASSLSEAFSLLPNQCVPSCPFTFTTTRSVASRIRTVTPMPLWSLLGGVAGSFLDVYGGEWDFDGLTASLPSSLGQDNGVSVRYGKNMTELEQDITVESTWAAVLPFWYNEETGQLVKTDQPVPVQGAFGSRVLTLDLSEEWEEAPTVAQLTARTEQYITANKIGDPQVAWKVNMAMLDQSEEYKGLAILERVQLGDTVTVVYEPYGIDIKARSVMIEYDVLAERYKSITLGRVKQNLAKIVASTPAEITAAVNAAKSALEKAIDSSTDFITHGAGYMRFIYNDDKVLQEIVSLDNPDINQAQSVWRWNNGGFGHSSTGYAGPYTVAMTQDGAIVADFITAGTLSGDRVRTGIITDVSGRNYWNLNTGEWKNVAIETTLENLQEQIDNNIETFTGAAVPTLTNYPANAWATTEEKDKHIGDLYVVNSQGGDYEGFYYRFEKTGSTYQWRLLKDTEVTKALADAEEALRRVGIAETQLEVQAGQIASKVSETDYNGNTIASKINQTATTVKINAQKIDLQGAVTISDFDSAAQAALVKNTTTKNQYAQSASSTTAPTSGWQDTIPAYNATNKYIWLRVATTKTFADNTSSTTYSTPVVDVNLTKSIQDAATAQSTATGAATAASTAQSTADAALGTTKSTQQYYLSTSSASATGGTWQDTVPTWSSGTYVWTRIKTDATTKSGTALSPVYSTAVYDANLTTALSTASSASSAASAAQSTADGAVTAAGTAQTTANNAASAASAAQTTANGAVKSSSVKTQYYLSTSASSATGGSWSDTIPTWADGKYLWTRIATTTTPVSGTASTTYQPSANGAYDSNLTNALSTATAAASTAAAAQTKANAALVTSVSVYFRASTSTVPGKPTAEVTSTAVDTSDAWTLCMPRPKKGTTYYTCEQNKDGNGTVSWTAVRQMANTTYVASWASSNNATYIDGASIYTGSVTADKIAANEVFTQKLTAQNFNITGGSIKITTSSATADVIELKYGTKSIRISPSQLRLMLDDTTIGARIDTINGGNAALYAPNISRINLYSSTGTINVQKHDESQATVLSYTRFAVQEKDSSNITRDLAVIDKNGLVFRNASDKVTAKYPNSPASTDYTPSNATLTFHSNSVIKVRKLGSVGVYSIVMQLNNPGDFATGAYYDLLTLPEGHRPWYVVSHIACNGAGSPIYIRVNTDGVVSIYRYAGAAWTNSWIRVEIPVIFANP